MKDEEKKKDEEEKNELMVTDYEELDKVEDQTIIEIMTGQAVQEYVYSFKQSGRTVEGLTLAGINEAANRRGGITVEDVQFEEKDDSWIAIVKATDTFTGSSRYGAFEQTKRMGGREDPFAFTKAIHKAQRNAIKQLLPVPIIKEVLNFYLHGQMPTRRSPQMALPLDTTHSASDRTSNVQKNAVAMANRLKDKLEQQGVSWNDFWDYVKRQYHAASRNDMTESQWTQLSKELQEAESSAEFFKNLITRIKQFEAAQTIAEETMEAASGESTSGESTEEKGQQEEPVQEDSTQNDSLF